MSSHLTGEITDELVDRCLSVYYKDRNFSRQEVFKRMMREALEEAVREPEVLCKNCRKPIYFVKPYGEVEGNYWRHTVVQGNPRGGLMHCEFKATPPE